MSPRASSQSLAARLGAAALQLGRLRADLERIAELAARRGAPASWRTIVADTSVAPLALLRGSAALRAAVGSSLGLGAILRVVYHIDVWTDDIGPGLRLPHPFCIVVGDGARVGERCTLMHNVTIQRGEGTVVGDHAVIANGATVLAGAKVGEGSLIGTASVVRGEIPPRQVAVGAPARAVRAVREGEVRS